MLNLLFISDSPRAEYIRSVLQPALKVIIDVVTDFDHGLKDVFEKRPTTVCIQDHIGGVTGESVARHIQMLLGNGAPTFILLHTGNDAVKAINGLFEHLIDLSQSDEMLEENIKNTLKSLLGDQWERIYIPFLRPQEAAPVKESREDSDKRKKVYKSDLEKSIFPIVDDHTGASQLDISVKSENYFEACDPTFLLSASDEVAELILLEKNRAVPVENSIIPTPLVGSVPGKVPIEVLKPAEAAVTSSFTSVTEMSVPAETAFKKSPLKKSAGSAPVEKDTTRTSPSPVSAPPTPQAAEFRISQHTRSPKEHIPDDLLQTFEENYRSEPQLMRRILIIAIVGIFCAGGVWFVVNKQPQIANSIRQRFAPSPVEKQSPVTKSATLPAQTPASSPILPPSVAPSLPSIIPKVGHDGSYAVKNPGWERYVGNQNEFRIFSVSGRIKAVQVLAVTVAPLPESLIKTVLNEFVGTPDFQILSRSTKAGVLVESGTVLNKGEVIIYRKKGAVKAFVVSIN